MIKNLLFFSILLLGSFPLQAQIETINLDIVTGKLNGANPIPAETEFYIQGSIPEKIEMVKLTIYPSKKTEKAGYSYYWKSPFGYKELS